MATISDVARAAGVGIGTVSRVINGSPLVSPATRRRVQEAIERLGYQPNPVARAFGRRRTHKLELLAPRFVAPFLFELMQGVEDALADTDYAVLVRSMDTPSDRDRAFETCCRRGRADGVVIVWTPPTEGFVDRLMAEPIPAVLLNAIHARLSSVSVDHDQAARRAAAYCLQLGHRRVALVDRFADPFADAGPGICKRGFDQALAAARVDPRPEYELTGGPEPTSGAAAMERLLDLPEPPTAVVVGSDAQAVGVLDRARSRERRVPADVSIVSYNESSISAFLGLTTVRLPLREMGKRSAELLLHTLIEHTAAPEAVVLDTELVVRATCAPPSS
jgi:DNA-binding LacI/PurR family transcriptional regulator